MKRFLELIESFGGGALQAPPEAKKQLDAKTLRGKDAKPVSKTIIPSPSGRGSSCASKVSIQLRERVLRTQSCRTIHVSLQYVIVVVLPKPCMTLKIYAKPVCRMEWLRCPLTLAFSPTGREDKKISPPLRGGEVKGRVKISPHPARCATFFRTGENG